MGTWSIARAFMAEAALAGKSVSVGEGRRLEEVHVVEYMPQCHSF